MKVVKRKCVIIITAIIVVSGLQSCGLTPDHKYVIQSPSGLTKEYIMLFATDSCFVAQPAFYVDEDEYFGLEKISYDSVIILSAYKEDRIENMTIGAVIGIGASAVHIASTDFTDYGVSSVVVATGIAAIYTIAGATIGYLMPARSSKEYGPGRDEIVKTIHQVCKYDPLREAPEHIQRVLDH